MRKYNIISNIKHGLYVFLLLSVFVVMAPSGPCLAHNNRCAGLKADLDRLNSDPRFELSLKNRWRIMFNSKKFHQMRDEYNREYLQIISRHDLPVSVIEQRLPAVWRETGRIISSPFLMVLCDFSAIHWSSYQHEVDKLAMGFCEKMR